MKQNDIPLLLRNPWTEKRLLKWLFLFATIIASIQFLQYYIFYNSSYPFPYLKNITASFGSFYTYFLFIPLIFKASNFAHKRLTKSWQIIVFHLIVAGLLSAFHLLFIHFLGWLQIYQWTDVSFFNSYRFLLSKWLHFEILIYGFIVFVWRGLDYIRWNQVKQTEEIAEPESAGNDFLTRIKIKDGKDTNFISIEQIRWIEAYDNYIKIMVNDRYFLVRKTISGIEKQLNPDLFQRIHRSQIVAMKEVKSLRSDTANHQVILTDQTSLKLSRTYKEQIEERLAQ
jgi:LytTr DNA-binding domain-containing protein